MRFLSYLAIASSLGCALNVTAECVNSNMTLCPPIESHVDKSLKNFLDKLDYAVINRDIESLMKLMGENVVLTFGPSSEQPIAKQLNLDNPNSRIWDEIAEMIHLGGGFPTDMHDYYCIPYVYSNFPKNLDPYKYSVITKQNVAAKDTPQHDGLDVIFLSYSIVETDFGSPVVIHNNDNSWVRIYHNKTKLYVPESALRSPIDKRVCFSKNENGWTIRAIVDGD